MILPGRKRVRSLSVIALFCLATVGVAAPDEYMDPAIGVRFPSKLGKLKLQDVKEYEDARLGRSLGYSGQGLEATIYTYNLGLPSIPAAEGKSAPLILY